MSCESNGVKVDHACSGPNPGPIVDSFGFEIGLSGSAASNVNKLARDVRTAWRLNHGDA
jgi:hypothetical protein